METNRENFLIGSVTVVFVMVMMMVFVVMIRMVMMVNMLFAVIVIRYRGNEESFD